MSVAEYIDMRGKKMTHWDSVRPLFEKYDLLLTPSVSVAAFPLGRLNPEHWPQHVWDWLPLGVVLLSLQLHRPAGLLAARGLHQGGAARRASRWWAVASPISPCSRPRRLSRRRGRGQQTRPEVD